MFGEKLLVETVVRWLEGKLWCKVWWNVWRESVGRMCGEMFGWKLLVESVPGCLEGKYW